MQQSTFKDLRRRLNYIEHEIESKESRVAGLSDEVAKEQTGINALDRERSSIKTVLRAAGELPDKEKK